MAKFVFLSLLIAFSLIAWFKHSGVVSSDYESRTRLVFLVFHFRSIGQLGHLPVSFTGKRSMAYFSLILLLGGDISTHPGPDSIGNIKLSFTNIRSLPKNHVPLTHYIRNNSIDMLCLSETWLTDGSTTFCTPTGFTLFHKPRGLVKKGGGVGFLIRDELPCNTIDSPSYSSFEHLVLQVKFQNRSTNFVSVYRPPGSSKTFMNDLVNFLDVLVSLSSDPVLVGDFNIDPFKHASAYTKYSEILSSYNLRQHVDVMTHIHGGTLDHFITLADSDLLKNRICINDCITDHLCMLACLNASFTSKSSPRFISYRKFHDIDKESLRRDLVSSDLLVKPSSTSCSDLYDQYHHTLVSLLDKYAPLCSKKVARQTEKWLSPEFFNAKRLKRRFERLWRRTKSSSDRSKFRQQVNTCNRIINNAKSHFYSNLIQGNLDKPKKLWQILRSALNFSQSSKLPDDPSDSSLANKFCKFFENKIDTIRCTFTTCNRSWPGPDVAPPFLSNFSSVEESDLYKIILNSPTKSCPLDPWPTFLVKDHLDILIKPLTQLVNLSLSDGVFPDKFKTAVITPLLKKPSLDTAVLKNYRPVSGLNFVSKVIERVVASQIQHHFSSNNIDNIYQSAYKAGHSTETALLKIKSDIHANLAQNKPTALLLLDLSSAFDTIDHSQLLARIHSWFGFSNKVLAWFTSYLGNRYQSVKVNKSISDPRPLMYGVPQGSVLGPLLFTLYTAPLSAIISSFKNIQHHLYADDTQIYIAITPHNAAAAIADLHDCLALVKNWMNSNKLKLNSEKTEFIVFGSAAQRSKLSQFFPTDIFGTLLFPVDKVRNLGVLFDASFTFSPQVSSICSSCYYHIRDLARIRRYLDKSTAISVANALVGSRIDYCNSLLDSISDFDMRRLRSIQYALCRIINRTSRYSKERMSPYLKALHWLPIRQRIDFKWFLLIYKSIHFGLPDYFRDYFVPYSSQVVTRRSNHRLMYLNRDIVPFDRRLHKSKSHYDNSFCISGPSRWNNLPTDVRCASSLGSFRSKLKTFLFNKAFPP